MLAVHSRAHLLGYDPWLQERLSGSTLRRASNLIQPDSGGKDVFVHISAVERAGLQGLHEGQKISYDVVNERGKDAAANLKA